jgi:hypothetical protein
MVVPSASMRGIRIRVPLLGGTTALSNCPGSFVDAAGGAPSANKVAGINNAMQDKVRIMSFLQQRHRCGLYFDDTTPFAIW